MKQSSMRLYGSWLGQGW